jgi:hypothetical protein
MNVRDIPLVIPRNERLTAEILRFIAECAKHYPGCEKDAIVIRKPGLCPATQEKEEELPFNDPIPL